MFRRDRERAQDLDREQAFGGVDEAAGEHHVTDELTAGLLRNIRREVGIVPALGGDQVGDDAARGAESALDQEVDGRMVDGGLGPDLHPATLRRPGRGGPLDYRQRDGVTDPDLTLNDPGPGVVSTGVIRGACGA
jgi:hypothetical protein